MSMVHEALRYAHDEGHTDVSYSTDGKKFVTCGVGGDIRIWPATETEEPDPIHICIGEYALCVRQHENNILVATGNNDVQILTYPEGERNGVLAKFVAPINHIAVSKDNDYIALAGEDMEIKLLQTKDKDNKIIFDGLTGPCLSVALSPDSKFLAASSGDGKLRVWNIESRLIVKELNCFPKVNSFANAQNLCRIDFEPIKGESFAYPDNKSVIVLDTTIWAEESFLICDNLDDSGGVLSIVQYSPCAKFLMATSTRGDFVVWNVSTGNVVSFSKHSRGLPICSFMWNPLGNGQVAYTDIEGQLGIVSGCIESNESKPNEPIQEESQFEDNEVGLEGITFGDDGSNDEDDENVVSVEKIKRQFLQELEPESELLANSPTATLRPKSPEVPQQQAFMPSSTPLHLNPRYLCWNDVGIIRSYGLSSSLIIEDDGNSDKQIEVEFHDSTFHSSMMIRNFADYTMGSISKSALVLANTNLINVIPLSSSKQEWNLKAEEFEEIILIASSENLICFATNNYRIRICSIFGTQRGIICVPGPIVCMNAFKDSLLVAYHGAGVRSGDQCINIQLIKFNGFAIESKEINSALGPESTLLWLGFSDHGTPAMMDSVGLLSMFPASCNIWIPFCDTTKHRKSPSDGFFVTTVFESYGAVGGIKCKGSIYPSFTPRPTMCELPLEPPFAEFGTDKTQMEANLFTWSNLNVQNVEKKMKEVGVKLFALSCQNNLDERSLELVELLCDPYVLSLALKYVTRLDKKRLADKLTELASSIHNSVRSNNVEQNSDSVETVNNTISVPKRLTLTGLSKRKLREKLETETINAIESHMSDPEISSPKILAENTLNDSSFSSQLSSIPEEPKNPFLKSLRKYTDHLAPNPLSLIDANAGFEDIQTISNRNKADEINEKRKLSDSSFETDNNQKPKQRKLDRFMFTKCS